MASVDCPDKTCNLNFKYTENCFIFVANNATHCDIPCELEACDLKFIQETKCPFWDCVEKVTTTPPPPPPPQSLSQIASLAFFIAFVIIFILVLLVKRKRILDCVTGQWRRRTFDPAFSNDDNSRNPQERDQETEPENANREGFDRVSLFSRDQDRFPQHDFFSLTDDEASIAILNVTQLRHPSNSFSGSESGRNPFDETHDTQEPPSNLPIPSDEGKSKRNKAGLSKLRNFFKKSSSPSFEQLN